MWPRKKSSAKAEPETMLEQSLDPTPEQASVVEEVPKKEDLVVDSHILSNPILPNIEEMKNYHSIMTKSAKTLISELKAEQLHFLQEALNHPKRMNLLFRAS